MNICRFAHTGARCGPEDVGVISLVWTTDLDSGNSSDSSEPRGVADRSDLRDTLFLRDLDCQRALGDPPALRDLGDEGK